MRKLVIHKMNLKPLALLRWLERFVAIHKCIFPRLGLIHNVEILPVPQLAVIMTGKYLMPGFQNDKCSTYTSIISHLDAHKFRQKG